MRRQFEVTVQTNYYINRNDKEKSEQCGNICWWLVHRQKVRRRVETEDKEDMKVSERGVMNFSVVKDSY